MIDNQKCVYEKAELAVLYFGAADIITASIDESYGEPVRPPNSGDWDVEGWL